MGGPPARPSHTRPHAAASQGPEFDMLQSIFDVIVNTEHAAHQSYIFECCSNARRLHYNFAMLMAHPQQRPPQKQFHASLIGDRLPAAPAHPQPAPAKAWAGAPAAAPPADTKSLGPAYSPETSPSKDPPAANPLHGIHRGSTASASRDAPADRDEEMRQALAASVLAIPDTQ